jgi:hypothetical protein
VTLTPGTTAPLGSVIVPETVASWVCDRAPAEKSAASTAARMQCRYHSRFWHGGAPILTSVRLMLNSVSFLLMAFLNLRQTACAKALRKCQLHTLGRDGMPPFIRPPIKAKVVIALFRIPYRIPL